MSKGFNWKNRTIIKRIERKIAGKLSFDEVGRVLERYTEEYGIDVETAAESIIRKYNPGARHEFFRRFAESRDSKPRNLFDNYHRESKEVDEVFMMDPLEIDILFLLLQRKNINYLSTELKRLGYEWKNVAAHFPYFQKKWASIRACQDPTITFLPRPNSIDSIGSD